MNKHYLITLTDYTFWADNIAMGWLNQIDDAQWNKSTPSSFSSIHATAVHIASAEKIWIDFWKNTPDPVYLSSEFKGTKEELITIWREASASMKYFLEHFPEEEYERSVVFRYPRGGEGQLKFWQTVSHIVNHSTYHRGQLVTLLRHAGFTHFTSIDLATYYRQHQQLGK